MASVLGSLAATFSLLSVSAVGGANATLPELHRQMVDVSHFMDDATFTHLVALAQSAPGPNVIMMSLMGWQVAAFPGFCVATLAMLAPSSALAFAVERTFRRFSASAAIRLARQALAPIAIGLMSASGLILARAADSGGLTVAITGGMTLLIARTRVNPLFGLAAVAILGLASHRLGFSL